MHSSSRYRQNETPGRLRAIVLQSRSRSVLGGRILVYMRAHPASPSGHFWQSRCWNHAHRKNTVAHNEPVSMFLPSLQNITSVSVGWDGPHQFNAKQHSFQISNNHPVMNERFGRKSSPPFFWLSVRTQSSLMISSRALPHFVVNQHVVSAAAWSFSNTPFSNVFSEYSSRRGTIYSTPNVSATNQNIPLPHPQKYGLFALSLL